MAAICQRMAGEGDSPEKCRESRSRRSERRRLPIGSKGTLPSSPNRAEKRQWGSEEGSQEEFNEKRSRTEDEDAPTLQPSPLPTSSSWVSSSTSPSPSSASGIKPGAPAIASTSGSSLAMPVAFGSISLSGRSREMEDAISVWPGFSAPKVARRSISSPSLMAMVSVLCKEWMHVLLAEELGREVEAATEEERMRVVVQRSFARMDELALSSCACGRVGLPLCQCERSGIESEIVGSTAVVALMGGGRLVVANCGDSRAVLSRGGRAVPLSDDHKPDRPDELARIEAAGGRVIYLNGARVHGMLAMSRAVGDKYLKPFVISEPEIRVVERTAEDECLIIASDGLWDVLPNDLACDVARRCLEEGDPTREDWDPYGAASGVEAGGPETGPASDAENKEASDARCSLAAALLARLALARKSADNISVIVIDLKRSLV